MTERAATLNILRRVTWEQEVHSGSTVSGTGLKVAALIGAVGGFFFGPGLLPVRTPEDFFVAQIGGMLLMPLFACGAWMYLMGQHWQGKDRHDLAEEDMIRARQHCTAILCEGAQGLELSVERVTLSGHRPLRTALLWSGVFVLLPIAAILAALVRRLWPDLVRNRLRLSGRTGPTVSFAIPHAAIEGFELSTGNAWFGPGTRGVGVDSWVIIAHITGKGPIVIAEDLRSKARMARLFGEITTAFGPEAARPARTHRPGVLSAAPNAL